MAKKLDLDKIRKEAAELQAERADVAARMAELDRRLSDDSSSLAELRAAADELADRRHYTEALDRRLAGLANQQRQAEHEEKKARIAAAQEKEHEAYNRFCEAVEAFSEGPMKELLKANRAVTDAGGLSRARDARNVIEAVQKYLRIKWMREQKDAGKMARELLA